MDFNNRIRVAAILVSSLMTCVSCQSTGTGKTALSPGKSLPIIDSTSRYYNNGQLQSGRLAAPVRINNILLCDYISLREDGTLENGTLKGDQKQGGLIFKGGEQAGFFSGGGLSHGTIIADAVINGIPIKAGTVYLHDNGSLRTVTLAKAFDGATILYRQPDKNAAAQKSLLLKNGSALDLTDSGRLARGTLEGDQTIQGLELPDESVVHFNAKGRLVSLYAPHPVTVGGILYGREDRPCELSFHENGNVASGISGAAQKYKDIPLPAKATLYFHPNGMLETVRILSAVTIHSIRFAESVSFDSAGFLTRGTLASAQTLQGVTFWESNEVTFHHNGLPASGLSKGVQTVQGLVIEENTLVTLHKNGKLATALLHGEQTMQGLPLTNSGPIPLPHEGGPERTTKKGIEFFPNGKIKQGYLARERKIDNILCQGGVTESHSYLGEATRITFHENGRLASAYLACPQKIDGMKLPGPGKDRQRDSYLVTLYPTGRLETCIIGPHTVKGDIAYAAGSELGLYENGKVKSGMLAVDCTIQGITLARGTFIRFSESGKLSYKILSSAKQCGSMKLPAGSLVFSDNTGGESQVVLSNDAAPAEGLALKKGTQLQISCGSPHTLLYLHDTQTIRKIPLPAGTEIALWPNPAIQSLSFTAPWRLAAFKHAPLTRAEFDEEGYLTECIPSEPVTIQGVTLPAGKEIGFYKDGTLNEWQLPENKRHKKFRVGDVDLLPEDEIIAKYPGGQIAEVNLAGNDHRKTKNFTYRHKIRFYTSGAVKEVFLADSCTIGTTPLASQTYAAFFDNGSLKKGFPADTTVFGAFTFSGDRWNCRDSIGFHKNGRISFGILYRDAKLSNTIYERGGTLFFDPSGKIKGYVPPPPPEIKYSPEPGR